MSTNFVFLGQVREMRRQQIESIASQYQTFNSVETMDKHLKRFVECWGLKLGDTPLMILEFLSRHSLKVIGVSWLSTKTLAGLVGVSDRTVQRILGRLEDLGIIKRVVTTRADGGQGNNLVVIQPVDVADELPDPEESAAALEVLSAIEQTAVTSQERVVTGGTMGDVVGDDTQNLLYLKNHFNLKKNDDEYISHYRFREYFKMAEEWNIPKEAAEIIFPAVKLQLLTTSWVALEIAFGKLKKHAATISSMAPWFSSTLASENLLSRIACS
jgi:predicted transcriptional regulator